MRRLFSLVVGGTFVACSPASAPEPTPASAQEPMGPTVVGHEESPDGQARPSAVASPPTPTEAAQAPPPPGPDPHEAATVPLCDGTIANRPCVMRTQGMCWFHGACSTGPPAGSVEPAPPPCGTPVEVRCRDDLPLPTEACLRLEACVGVSDEGCCVGCNNPFRSRIATSCAPRIEAARDCAAISVVARTAGCVQ